MKHIKFKYHTWNKIRNFMNKPYKNKNFYAHIIAWYYFQFKEYEEV